MAPRITMSLKPSGALEIYLNDEGRNLLIHELKSLNEKSEHFHLGAWDGAGAEVKLSSKAYRSNDKLISAAKILFRTDEWDRQHYPHVLDEKN